jgi:type II secretory pathway component GspD/PulD (secretin)
VSLDSITKLIATLDGRTREVQLEMRFVEFSNSDAQRIGLDPINTSFDIKGIGQLSPSFTPFNDIFGGGLNFTTTSPSPGSSGNFSAQLAFEALTTLSSSEILQAPQILTLDNRPATIRIGREIHYAETTITQNPNGSGSLITLKEASASPVKDGVEIKVTPHITSDGFVSIEMEAKNETANLLQFTNGQAPNSPNFAAIELPTINTTELKTTIMVADGKTGVIGGILTNESREETRQMPLLGSLPGLGWLFKKRSDSIEQRNLTVFITPRIIQTKDNNPQDEKQLKVRERLSGLSLRPKVEETPNSALSDQ